MHRLRLCVSGFALLLAACDDGIGPLQWAATPDTFTIFSVSRAELLGKPAALDVAGAVVRTVVVESAAEAGTWDFALAEHSGVFVMLPASVVPQLDERVGIATMTETSLEAVAEAPGDTARYAREAVPIQPGTVYVIRSRRDQCGGFGGTGVRYAKLKALSLDATTGSFEFEVVRNPFCNDRRLIPPDDD
jgi:hypothetical protein